jgi:rubrerythrin
MAKWIKSEYIEDDTEWCQLIRHRVITCPKCGYKEEDYLEIPKKCPRCGR